MLDVGRYSELEIRKALDQAQKRREYQKRYAQSSRGKLAQRRAQVKFALIQSGTFTAAEVETIIAKIRLPEVDGDPAGDDGRVAASIEGRYQS